MKIMLWQDMLTLYVDFFSCIHYMSSSLILFILTDVLSPSKMLKLGMIHYAIQHVKLCSAQYALPNMTQKKNLSPQNAPPALHINNERSLTFAKQSIINNISI